MAIALHAPIGHEELHGAPPDSLRWVEMPAPETDTRVRPQHLEFRRPVVADGASMWRIAKDSGALDLNSSYAYLLWCRDFAATSIVADAGDQLAGFVTGYRRPDQPDTLVVWQVAVAESQRGQGIAGQMLAELADRTVVQPPEQRVDRMETTITPDNEASIALFTSFAHERRCRVEQIPLFHPADFPDGHDTEVLFRIGPWCSR